MKKVFFILLVLFLAGCTHSESPSVAGLIPSSSGENVKVTMVQAGEMTPISEEVWNAMEQKSLQRFDTSNSTSVTNSQGTFSYTRNQAPPYDASTFTPTYDEVSFSERGKVVWSRTDLCNDIYKHSFGYPYFLSPDHTRFAATIVVDGPIYPGAQQTSKSCAFSFVVYDSTTGKEIKVDTEHHGTVVGWISNDELLLVGDYSSQGTNWAYNVGTQKIRPLSTTGVTPVDPSGDLLVLTKSISMNQRYVVVSTLLGPQFGNDMLSIMSVGQPVQYNIQGVKCARQCHEFILDGQDLYVANLQLPGDTNKQYYRTHVALP